MQCLTLVLFGGSLLIRIVRGESATSSKKILVVGSVNADTFLRVERWPTPGENILTIEDDLSHNDILSTVDVPGGKGCTQAIAAAKLITQPSADSSPSVLFVGQFGNDSVAPRLQETLKDANVDLTHSRTHERLPCGRGMVVLCPSHVSAIVHGGTNRHGWKLDQRWKAAFLPTNTPLLDSWMEDLLHDCGMVMLQREIPDCINLYVAEAVQAYNRKHTNRKTPIRVVLDLGGDDRPLPVRLLHTCDYIMPNQSELERLVIVLEDDDNLLVRVADMDNLRGTDTKQNIIDMARKLQDHGARNIVVTCGSQGSIFVRERIHQSTATGPEVLQQPAASVEHVVDETGAGDSYRAAFVVALLEGSRSIQECLEFASAAGSCAVQQMGAVPSTPTRQQVEERLKHLKQQIEELHHAEDSVLKIPRGDGLDLKGGALDRSNFPFLIGSRLNSMKDRPELWGGPLQDPKDYVRRQGTVEGLTCVDFNYPQHFLTWSDQEAKQALDDEGLVAGAVCLRYPSKFARGAMNHPDPDLRREAIELTKEAAQAALNLGCNEVVVWSAYDGYDYCFQVDYDEKWQQLVDAFRECCDAFPEINFSVEYKPTDENTRFFTIPSTGAALLMVNEVNRDNFGLTLDVGHMLMAGENPGQSIAMVGRQNKLFGIQLNDGYTRLAAEDGLMFGSVHPCFALEIMYQLRRINFRGHFYFDTFPQRTDPVQEAAYNIRRAKAFWDAGGSLSEERLRDIVNNHDAGKKCNVLPILLL